MKTAIEWLEDNLISEPLAEEHFKYNRECWNKAKEMEENRIKEAVMDTFKNSEGYEWGMTAEEYYNEIFKSK